MLGAHGIRPRLLRGASGPDDVLNVRLQRGATLLCRVTLVRRRRRMIMAQTRSRDVDMFVIKGNCGVTSHVRD